MSPGIGFPAGEKVGRPLAECLESFDPRQPSESIPGLLSVHAELAKLPDEDWVRIKRRNCCEVIQACAGIWMEAIAGDFAAAPGDEIQIKTAIVNRSDQPFALHGLGFPGIVPDSVFDRPLKNNEPLTIETRFSFPKDFPSPSLIGWRRRHMGSRGTEPRSDRRGAKILLP